MIIVHNDQEITNVEKLAHTTFKLNNQDGVTFPTSYFPVLQAVIILLQSCHQAVAKLIMMTASQQLDHDDKLLQSCHYDQSVAKLSSCSICCKAVIMIKLLLSCHYDHAAAKLSSSFSC